MFKTSRIKLTECQTLMAIILVGLIYSQPPLWSANTNGSEYGWSAEDKSWMSETWTSDDRPYAQIRKSLTQHNPVSWADVHQFENAWEKDPSDPLLLFKWSYAATLLYIPSVFGSNISHQSAPIPSEFSRVSQAYENFPLTHSFEFDRLHLIYDVESGASTDDFTSITKRLYEHCPTDPKLMYIYCQMLVRSDSASDIIQAATIADKLVDVKPTIPMNHIVYGESHYLKYWRTGQFSDLEKALQGYKAFLKMSPENDPFRPQAVEFIKHLRPQIERAKRGGYSWIHSQAAKDH